MSSNRKRIIRNTVAVNIGCGCQGPKLSNIFRPKPKSKTSYRKADFYASSSSSWERCGFLTHKEDHTTTPFSPNINTSRNHFEAQGYYDLKSSKEVRGFGKIDESVAVVKDSDDPYLDFCHSMLQMILEKEMYTREDLQDLLDCFLQLNSPWHHEIIVQAFMEIWKWVFSVRPVSGSGSLKPCVQNESRWF